MHRGSSLNATLFLAVVLALGLLGCMSAAAPTTLTLSENDNGGSAILAVGQELVITLPSNPSTGYRWQVTAVDAAVLAQVGNAEYTASGEVMPGSGGWKPSVSVLPLGRALICN